MLPYHNKTGKKNFYDEKNDRSKVIPSACSTLLCIVQESLLKKILLKIDNILRNIGWILGMWWDSVMGIMDAYGIQQRKIPSGEVISKN